MGGAGKEPEPERCSSIDFGLGFQTQPQQAGSEIRLLLLLFALPAHRS